MRQNTVYGVKTQIGEKVTAGYIGEVHKLTKPGYRSRTSSSTTVSVKDSESMKPETWRTKVCHEGTLHYVMLYRGLIRHIA